MPNKSNEIRRAQARLSILTRWRSPDDPERLRAQKEYAELMLEDYVARVSGMAPWLTVEQLTEIRRLLVPVDTAAETPPNRVA